MQRRVTGFAEPGADQQLNGVRDLSDSRLEVLVRRVDRSILTRGRVFKDVANVDHNRLHSYFPPARPVVIRESCHRRTHYIVTSTIIDLMPIHEFKVR